MSPAEVVARFLQGPITDARLKKAARLLTPAEVDRFISALPEDLRDTVGPRIKPLVK